MRNNTVSLERDAPCCSGRHGLARCPASRSIASRRPSRPIFHCSRASTILAALRKDDAAFVSLCDSLASAFAPGTKLQAAPTPLGRGLVAVGPIREGSTLLSVDWCNLLCVNDAPRAGGVGSTGLAGRVLSDWQALHGDLPPLLVRYLLNGENKADWFSRMAAWLLWLRRHGAGPWAAYSRLLPQDEDATCLLSFSPEEAEQLQWRDLREIAKGERRQILDMHDRLFSAERGELRALRLAPSPSDTLWAAAMVNSRCFGDTVEGAAVTFMVPGADMVNHSPSPNAAYRYDTDADSFQLYALRDLAYGEEALIRYDWKKDNLGLMRDYGFMLPACINDRVPFDTGDDVHSRTAAGGAPRVSLDAARLMAALGIEAKVAAAGGQLELAGAAAAAALGGACDDASVELRRRVVTLLSLAPFLRGLPAAGSSSQQQGVEPAEQPLDDAALAAERQSIAALRQQCASWLERLPTSAEADEAVLAGQSLQGRGAGERSEGDVASMTPRVRAAVAARLERKRLVAAASEALALYERQLA